MAFIKQITTEQKGTTYGEMLDRFVLLNQVKNLQGEKLCFARSKNLMQLRTFEKRNSAKSRIPISDEYNAYQKKHTETRGKYLLTDSTGKAVLQQVQTENGIESVPTIDIANSDLIRELAVLKEKYQDAIEERETDLKAYREFMEETIPDSEMPKIHMVQLADASGLNQDQVDATIWFIEE